MSTTKKKTEFVGKHSKSGNGRVIIIIPKEYMDSVNALKNPMHVIVEEIISCGTMV